jgi:16S rRNA (cytosine967-C5)-methyltransferase
VENAERVRLTGSNDDQFLRRRQNWFDRVLVFAPNSGSGLWRRHPETKWKPGQRLGQLTSAQDSGLRSAATLVKRGGRLIYSTGSLLADENEARVAAFLRDQSEFKLLPAAEIWAELSPLPWPSSQPNYLKLTPAQHGTDGYFAAVLERTRG